MDEAATESTRRLLQAARTGEPACMTAARVPVRRAEVKGAG